MNTLDNFLQNGKISSAFIEQLKKQQASAEFCVTRTMGASETVDDPHSGSLAILFQNYCSILQPIGYLSKPYASVSYLEFTLLTGKIWLISPSHILEELGEFIVIIGEIIAKPNLPSTFFPNLITLLTTPIDENDQNRSLLFYLTAIQAGRPIIAKIFSSESVNGNRVLCNAMLSVQTHELWAGLSTLSNLCQSINTDLLEQFLTAYPNAPVIHKENLTNALTHQATVEHTKGESALGYLLATPKGLEIVKKMLYTNRRLFEGKEDKLYKILLEKPKEAMPTCETVFDQLMKQQEGVAVCAMLLFQQAGVWHFGLLNHAKHIQKYMSLLINHHMKDLLYYLAGGSILFDTMDDGSCIFMMLCEQYPEFLLRVAVDRPLIFISKVNILRETLVKPLPAEGDITTLYSLSRSSHGRALFHWLVNNVDQLIPHSLYSKYFETLMFESKKDELSCFYFLAIPEYEEAGGYQQESKLSILDTLTLKYCGLFLQDPHRLAFALIKKRGLDKSFNLLVMLKENERYRGSQVFFIRISQADPSVFWYLVSYDINILSELLDNKDRSLLNYTASLKDVGRLGVYCESLYNILSSKSLAPGVSTNILYYWVSQVAYLEALYYLFVNCEELTSREENNLWASFTAPLNEEKPGYNALMALANMLIGHKILLWIVQKLGSVFNKDKASTLYTMLSYVDEEVSVVAKVSESPEGLIFLFNLFYYHTELFLQYGEELMKSILLVNNEDAIVNLCCETVGKDILFYLYFQFPDIMNKFSTQIVDALLIIECQNPGFICNFLGHKVVSGQYDGNTVLLALVRYEEKGRLLEKLGAYTLRLTTLFIESIYSWTTESALNPGESVLLLISRFSKSCDFVYKVLESNTALVESHAPVIAESLSRPSLEEGEEIQSHLMKSSSGELLVKMISRLTFKGSISDGKSFV